MGTFIAFGAKPPQVESEIQRRALLHGVTSDAFGIFVDEGIEHVAKALATNEMFQFTRVFGDDRYPVYVNPASVVYVQADESD